MEKTCRGCKQLKKISEYYRHGAMSDGYLGKCKSCVKARVSAYSKTERGKENEKRRHKSKKRQDWIREWTPKYYEKNKDRINKYKEVWAKENPEKTRKSRKRWEDKALADPKRHKKIMARRKARWHAKMGNIKKTGCVVCGEVKVHGHHEDYDKPLEVIWLCGKHHRELHKKI